jgi:hypothetical protein
MNQDNIKKFNWGIVVYSILFIIFCFILGGMSATIYTAYNASSKYRIENGHIVNRVEIEEPNFSVDFEE